MTDPAAALAALRDADVIGSPFFAADAPWCGSAAHLSLTWDSWAVAKVICHHGEFKGVSDPINLSKALDRAVTAWRAADHPNWCLADFEATGDTHTFMAGCQLWVDHDGQHGFPEDDDG